MSPCSRSGSSYRRALPIQAGLAVLGGAAGLVAWYYLLE